MAAHHEAGATAASAVRLEPRCVQYTVIRCVQYQSLAPGVLTCQKYSFIFLALSVASTSAVVVNTQLPCTNRAGGGFCVLALLLLSPLRLEEERCAHAPCICICICLYAPAARMRSKKN